MVSSGKIARLLNRWFRTSFSPRISWCMLQHTTVVRRSYGGRLASHETSCQKPLRQNLERKDRLFWSSFTRLSICRGCYAPGRVPLCSNDNFVHKLSPQTQHNSPNPAFLFVIPTIAQMQQQIGRFSLLATFNKENPLLRQCWVVLSTLL